MSTHTLSDNKKELFAKLAKGKVRMDKIPKRAPSDTSPLSFAQQRLWFLEKLMPGSATYNMHEAVRIRGIIDPQLLKRALSLIVSRHETLRTTFAYEKQEPIQKINPPYEVELPTEHAPNEQRAVEIAREETIRPFDLEKGPLFRARLIQLAKEDHILLWTMHHIISDGWSLGLIIKEVMILLEAFSQGFPSPLKPLPIQYSDFAVWQKEWLKEAVLEKQIAYWKNELAGDFPPLQLPFDYSRPAILSNKGKRKVACYPVELMERLTLLSTKNGATIFMVLLAAWKVLLYRYSGMSDLFVGVPVANRNRAEISELIGFFANTLVIRSEVQADLQFVDLLKQVKTKSLAAYQHQDLPFERIVEILKPKRELNTSAFFQVMFVLQNQPMPKVEKPGLVIQPIEIHNGTCKFDLLLNIYEDQVGIEYNTELFSENTIARMLEHYRSILEAVTENPNLSLLEIPLLSAAERHRLLIDWNQTEANFDISKTLAQYVEEQAAKTPLKIAVTDEGNSLTYEQLNNCANHLSHRLIDSGIGPNIIVAVYMPRSIEQVISFLAVLKAGGAYLPLDSEYPEERLIAMLQGSQAPILLYKQIMPSWALNISLLGIDVSLSSANETLSNPNCRASAGDLAYVIYTSGSTGKPNGVMIPHRGICNRLLWMQKEYQLTNNDKVIQKTSCSFDVSVWEFFWPLIVGAELIIARPGIHRSPSELACFIQQYDVTVIHFVPSMLRLFLQKVGNCPSLRLIFCSGETLPYELARSFMENTDAKLHNLYGPTEASIDVTYWDCTQETQKHIVPIGRPIANTQIYILDSRREPVPIGVTGELYIGGIGVGLGYLNNPELTAAKFIPNPFIPSQVLYRTGDLARFWENGEIEFLGRIDDQVKVRGVRIELAEIEQALLEYPGVQSATLALQEDQLTAYLVLSHTRSQEVERIRGWQTVFESTYNATQTGSPLMDTTGWNSSYTSLAIPQEEMEEWIDDKIQRILKLNPKKILEIGCGTGMLLFRLAEQTDLYIGTDISQKALSLITSALPSTSIDPTAVRLFSCSAHDFSPFKEETFDLVILNSVVQYFPSIEYFLEVLNKAIAVLTPGGAVFLGDLRNLALRESFYMSVILENAEEEIVARPNRA
jgi:amino acid adenylation domain-containing protein